LNLNAQELIKLHINVNHALITFADSLSGSSYVSKIPKRIYLIKYKNDIQIISILLEENKSNEYVTDFMHSNGIKFIITNSDDNFKLAQGSVGVKSIPFMLIYDRNGNYSQHYTGAIPEEMIEEDIKKVL